MDKKTKKELETQNPKLIDEKLKSGKIGGIYCFFGEEEYMADYYINKLLAGGPNGDFDCAVFASDSFDLGLFRDAVTSYPVLSEYKIAVVKNADAIKFKSGEKEALVALLSENKREIEELACVIFKMKTLSEPVQQKADGAKSKKSGPSLAGFLKENANLFEFPKNPPASLVKWIKKIAASEQTEISDENARQLLERTEPFMYPLKSELDKLVRYAKAENRAQITAQDIELLVSKKIESEAFELTNAILDKKYGKAVEILEKLKNLKEEPIAVFSQIARYFGDLLPIQMAMSAGAIDHYSVAKKTGIHEYKAKLAMGFLGKYENPSRFIRDCLDLCKKCDLKLKSTSQNSFALIENLLFGIAGL